MHFVEKEPSQKRLDFDLKLKSNKILRVPGAYNPLTAKLIEEIGKEIFEKIIAVASGEKSKSESNGYGDDEFNPWIIDPTL